MSGSKFALPLKSAQTLTNTEAQSTDSNHESACLLGSPSMAIHVRVRATPLSAATLWTGFPLREAEMKPSHRGRRLKAQVPKFDILSTALCISWNGEASDVVI